MKMAPRPWKLKCREVVLESCRKSKPGLVWNCSPALRLGDYVTLSVFDGRVRAETSISLKLIWKAGKRRNFEYLKTLTGKLLDDFHAKHEALRDQGAAATQAWEKTIAPREERA